MRLIFMGSHALADGFALLGFETFPNATTDSVENLLSELLKNKDKALVFLEDNLTRQPGPTFYGPVLKQPALSLPKFPHSVLQKLIAHR
ncbi:conserved hypothetical protein [Beggiatoa sp. PS]|nr:conserved hypothetical protein [Beggiatoa sp. PS]